MNENAKKIGLGVIVVAAIAAAIFSGSKFMAGDKIVVQNTWDMGPNHKSEKELALEAKNGKANAAPTEERDLSK